MKQIFLLLAILAGMGTALSAQIRLKTHLPACNTVYVSVDGLPAAGQPFFTFWLEQLQAPGIWSETTKKYSRQPFETFENLPAGTYRALCLLEWPAPYPIENSLVSAVFKVGPCVGDYPVPVIPAGIPAVYPNPATSILHIRPELAEPDADMRLDLFDLLGTRVLSVSLQADEQDIPIDRLTSGAYIACIYQNGQLISRQQVVVLNRP
jgi:hypothetical protein